MIMDQIEVAPAKFQWTPELDAAVADGFKEGLSARLIGEKLGVSRNAVLGRTFRLGICKPRDSARVPRHIHRAGRQSSLVRVSMREKISPDQLIERIIDLKDIGLTWNEISFELKVSIPILRNWAIMLGGYEPIVRKRFTPEDFTYLQEAWLRNDTLEQIADHLGRSWGVIRQTILALQRKKIIGTRDGSKTRLLKQYGEAALAAGATPAEALHKMTEAKREAFAAALRASREAKRKHKDHSLVIMRAALAAGQDRDACIFAARADGVTLEEIASEVDVTRERVRQICNAYAQVIALRGLTQ